MADEAIQRRGSRFKDLAGQRIGKLVVVSLAPFRFTPSGKQRTFWLCSCDCGAKKEIWAGNLANGHTRSCGCLEFVNPAFKHGRKGTPEYLSWRAMIDRCHLNSSKAYHRYGARGITVCDEWRRSFVAFFDHVGPKPTPHHTIDRIDNNGGYEPGNVRWATKRDQRLNQRPRKRKSHCPRGHEYTPDNTYVDREGHRYCRLCTLERNAQWARSNRRSRGKKT